MRRRSLLLFWVLIWAFAAGPALGAVFGDKPKKHFNLAPTTAVAPAGLRGPLDAPAAAQHSAPPLPLALPGPGASFVGLNTAGFAAPPPITPLRAVGDPAPICRATCANARVVCAAGQDLNCDDPWVRCVSDCSTGVLR